MIMLILGEQPRVWVGNHETTGHGSLIMPDLADRILFVSERSLEIDTMWLTEKFGCEAILKAARGVFGDKGFIGADYITTPVRKPESCELT